MWRDRISDTNPLRQCHDALANLLYCRRVFRLHRDKTIRDYRPQQERDPRPLGEIWSLIAADVFLPIDRAELVQCPENFVRQWHHNVFHSRGQLVNINVLRSLRAMRTQGKAADHSYDELQMFSKRNHWELEC